MRHSARIALSLALTLCAGSAFAAEKVGVVGSTNPSATATDASKAQRALKIGDDVFLNDTISTDGKGAVQVMFLDKSALTVNPGSAVTIDTFVYDPSTSAGKMTLQSAKGAMRFIGGALSKQEPVTIKTPVATIGIRGGIADVSVNGATGKTNSVFIYGQEMSTENASGQRTVTSTMGSGFAIDSATAAPRPMDTAALTSHVSNFQANTVLNSNPAAMPASETIDTRVGTMDNGAGGPSPSAPNGDPNAAPAGPQGSAPRSGSGDSANAAPGGAPNEGGNAPANGNDAANAAPGNAPPPEKLDAPLANNTPGNGPANGPGGALAGGPGSGPNGPGGFTPGLNPAMNNGLPPVNAQNITNTAGQDTTRNLANVATNGGTLPPSLTPPPPLPPTNTPPTTLPPATTPPPTETVPPVVVVPPATTNPPTTTPPPVTPPVTYTHSGLFAVVNSTAPGASNLNVVEQGLNQLNVSTALEGKLTTHPAGTIHNSIFDRPVSEGFSSLAEGTYGSSDYDGANGHMFASENLSMIYYHLEQSAWPNKQLNMITGTRLNLTDLPVSATNTTTDYGVNGITFYDFLPDLYHYHSGASEDWGWFSQNIASASLVPSGAAGQFSSNSTTNQGLMVDWTNGAFISGELYWGNASEQPSVGVGFGQLNTSHSSGDPMATGIALHLDAKVKEGAVNEIYDFEKGNLRIGNDVYGASGGSGTIDGMLLEGVMPNVPFAGDPFVQPGEQLRQPVAIREIVIPPTALYKDTLGYTNGIYNGFAAGVLLTDVNGGTPGSSRIWNIAPGEFTITRDATNGTVGAEINVETLEASPGTNPVAVAIPINATFGNDAGKANVLLRDRIYATQQGTMDYNGVAATKTSDSMLVSAQQLGNAPVVCASCEYAHWGVWAGKIERSAGVTDVVNMVPYVAGKITTDSELTAAASTVYALSGNTSYSVTYNGGVLAVKQHSSGNIYHDQGTFSAGINLGTRQVTTFNLNAAGANMALSGGPVNFEAGTATVQNIPLIGSGLTGSANGALFGPAAENMGGNFQFGDGSTVKVDGIYMGARP